MSVLSFVLVTLNFKLIVKAALLPWRIIDANLQYLAKAPSV